MQTAWSACECDGHPCPFLSDFEKGSCSRCVCSNLIGRDKMFQRFAGKRGCFFTDQPAQGVNARR